MFGLYADNSLYPLHFIIVILFVMLKKWENGSYTRQHYHPQF